MKAEGLPQGKKPSEAMEPDAGRFRRISQASMFRSRAKAKPQP